MTKDEIREDERTSLDFLRAIRDGEFGNPHDIGARIIASQVLLEHSREVAYMDISTEGWEDSL